MVWGFCVYFVYMIPLETDVLRKHRFQKIWPNYAVRTAKCVIYIYFFIPETNQTKYIALWVTYTPNSNRNRTETETELHQFDFRRPFIYEPNPRKKSKKMHV